MSGNAPETLEERVLVLAPAGRDGPLTCQLLAQAGIVAETCRDLADLCGNLRAGAAAVIMTDEALERSGSLLLTAELNASPNWSDLPLIVLTSSRRGSERAWQLAATLGSSANMTLLERPLGPRTLVSAVQSALRARKRQYQVRDHLEERKRAEQQIREMNETLEQRVTERTAEVEHRLAQLRAMTTELTLAEHRERQRLAKILHDHLQQLLVGARFQVSTVRGRIAEPQILQALDQVSSLLDESVQASRSLTASLFPPILQEGSFTEALRWLIQWMQEKHSLQVHLKADEQLNPQNLEIRLVLFEATRELLFNIVKHAGVREARLEMLRHDANQVRITIVDSGKGFDAVSLKPGERMEGGFGMVSIRERLRLLGGQIDVQSTSGHGTRATLVAPLQL